MPRAAVRETFHPTPEIAARDWPITQLLACFALLLALPFIVALSVQILGTVRAERSDLEEAVQRAAGNFATEVEGEVARHVVRAEALAAVLQEIERGDASTPVYEKIQEKLRGKHDVLDGRDASALLIDASGTILLDTGLALGSATRQVRGDWIIEDFDLRVTPAKGGRKQFNIGIPVLKDDKPWRVLWLYFDAATLLERQNVDNTWSKSIVDQKGNEVAATAPIGDGSKVIRKMGTTTKWLGLTVWVGAAKPNVSAVLRDALSRFEKYAPLAAAFIFLAVAGCVLLGRIISRPIETVALAAKRLGAGEQALLAPSRVQEVNAVGFALRDAAALRLSVEQQLRDSQERMRLALDASDAGVWAWDADSGAVAADEAYRFLFGFGPRDEINHAVWETRLHPADRDELERLFQARLQNGSRWQEEFRILHPTHGERWLAGRGRVMRDDAGRPTGMTGINFDITERKLAEERARQWQLTFEASDLAIALIDPTDHKFVEVNPAFARERGYTCPELAGRSILEIFAPKASAEAREVFHAIEDSGHVSFDSTHERKDGSRFSVLMEVTLIRGAWGAPVSCVVYARDITARKAAEARLRESNGEIAHRLKNLLRVVYEMATETVRTSSSLKGFEAGFTGRVEALARSHAALLEDSSAGVAVDQLIELHVTPFVDRVADRLEQAGPKLLLKSRIVRDLGAALHELATNAMKHGALKAPSGRIAATWTCDPLTEQFELTWRESGGPPVREPDRMGFGHKILSEIIGHHGKVSLEYRPEGLLWTFTAPISTIVRSTEP